ncbi:uncharacterized protein LOC119998837 [Tripterygium wilfordii]|uniref:uncharacterized protein LOC119998837 n=1 Tax=Tripterygium wilfordii TaxID=458696 RepID=UPI0018F83392|nr:uncharacterized protein LOC119998837 [Tripterygium wilfordii]XP_038702215.1 uncharacterized protein LOC119998837 [Tripterygium wilfordii]
MASKRARIVVSEEDELKAPPTFVNADAKEDFDKYWKKKRVTVERQWKLDDFQGITVGKFDALNWKPRIVELGWKKLVEFSGPCHQNLVREFFANISESSLEGNGRMVSIVRGKEVVLTYGKIRSFFSLPPSPPGSWFSYEDESEDWDVIMEKLFVLGTVWQNRNVRKGLLKWDYVPLHESSCYNLFPQGRSAGVGKDRAQFLYAIIVGRRIDMPRFIFCHIHNCHLKSGDSQTSIPYGAFLTEMIRKAGVISTVDLETATNVLGPIDHICMGKSWAGRLRASVQRQPQEQEEDVEPGESSSVSQPSFQQIMDMIQGLRTDVDARLLGIEQRQKLMYSRQELMQTRQDEIYNMVQFLVSRHPDWPPQPPSSSSTHPLLLPPPPADD